MIRATGLSASNLQSAPAVSGHDDMVKSQFGRRPRQPVPKFIQGILNAMGMWNGAVIHAGPPVNVQGQADGQARQAALGQRCLQRLHQLHVLVRQRSMQQQHKRRIRRRLVGHHQIAKCGQRSDRRLQYLFFGAGRRG